MLLKSENAEFREKISISSYDRVRVSLSNKVYCLDVNSTKVTKKTKDYLEYFPMFSTILYARKYTES